MINKGLDDVMMMLLWTLLLLENRQQNSKFWGSFCIGVTSFTLTLPPISKIVSPPVQQQWSCQKVYKLEQFNWANQNSPNLWHFFQATINDPQIVVTILAPNNFAFDQQMQSIGMKF
eukprot:TRINITY_DN4239_c2_g1_i1.p4 TRINITY_DN4239_c2_g1~~TRINITY_DN4239_c2_g1_i1.p4  ORF type:complete len:117 (-),score=6.68 TRINITY_DN4239_c2_g1_i1:385-735(-)